MSPDKVGQGVARNLELMRTLDDAWNSQDWATFRKRHAEKTEVYWPGQPNPTRGRDDHEAEAREFFKTFPDNHLVNNLGNRRVNNPTNRASHRLRLRNNLRNVNLHKP